MSKCWARARAPSKTSWARAQARALRYQRELFVLENAYGKNSMSSFRNCMSFYALFNHIFGTPLKRRALMICKISRPYHVKLFHSDPIGDKNNKCPKGVDWQSLIPEPWAIPNSGAMGNP